VIPAGDENELGATAAKLDERRRAVDQTVRAIGAVRRRNERTYGPAAVWNSLTLFFAVVFAGGLPGYLGFHGVISPQAMSWLIPVAMLGTFAAGLFVVRRWQDRDGDADGRGGGAAGDDARAPVPLPPPDAGPSLSREAIDRALRDLDRAARRARLALFAEQRRAVTLVPSAVAHLDLIIGGSLLLPLGGACFVMSILMIAGRAKYDPLIWLAWPLFFAGVRVVVELRRWRARRAQALADALDRLGAGIGAQPLGGFDGVVAWLDRYWPAAPGPNDLFKGAIERAIGGAYRGYPVLVDVEPDGYTSEDSSIDPRVLIYVAALAPAQLPAGDEIASLTASIRAAGFELELLGDAGLRARANAPTVKRLRRAPDGLADLAAVVRDLVRLAEACQAAPAPEP
jgi:hypothetical protein